MRTNKVSSVAILLTVIFLLSFIMVPRSSTYANSSQFFSIPFAVNLISFSLAPRFLSESVTMGFLIDPLSVIFSEKFMLMGSIFKFTGIYTQANMTMNISTPDMNEINAIGDDLDYISLRSGTDPFDAHISSSVFVKYFA